MYIDIYIYISNIVLYLCITYIDLRYNDIVCGRYVDIVIISSIVISSSSSISARLFDL